MIERRQLMCAALAAPVLAVGGAALACDYLPYTAEDNSEAMLAVREVFERWFAQDRTGFENAFVVRRSGLAASFVAELQEKISESRTLFPEFFSQPDFNRAIHLLVSAGKEFIVGCYEIDVSADADHGACDDTPYFHMFRVVTYDGAPVELKHISTTRNPYIWNIGVWTGG